MHAQSSTVLDPFLDRELEGHGIAEELPMQKKSAGQTAHLTEQNTETLSKKVRPPPPSTACAYNPFTAEPIGQFWTKVEVSVPNKTGGINGSPAPRLKPCLENENCLMSNETGTNVW